VAVFRTAAQSGISPVSTAALVLCALVLVQPMTELQTTAEDSSAQ
jgi:hypothetical protein